MMSRSINCAAHRQDFALKRAAPSFAFAFGIIIGFLFLLHTASLAASAHDEPVKSSGCGAPSVHTGVLNLKSTDGDNRIRTYLLQVPAAYDPSRPYALIFVFHGAGGNSQSSYSSGLQNAGGASANAVFVFPDGIPFKNLGIGWDDTTDGYDLPFFDHILRDLAATYCIDTARVFVTGFSWGGDFVTALACNRGDKIRAVVANSTDDEFSDSSNYMTYQDLPCQSHKHPALRFQHAVGGDRAYPAPDFATTSRLFKYLNSCSAEGTVVEPRTTVMSCVAYKSCASEYTECFFDSKIGHALPPNWAGDTWAFFSSF
jgi:poly(3-hydroxybutyrate) depolymerase